MDDFKEDKEWNEIVDDEKKEEIVERLKNVENRIERILSEDGNRRGAEFLANEISVDEPAANKEEIKVLLWKEICRLADIPTVGNKQTIRNVPELENHEKDKEQRNLKDPIEKMLSDGRRKLGLYPVDKDHIDQKGEEEQMNNKKYNDIRKEAVKDFLEKELGITVNIIIKQTKWNQKASILWIETETEQETFEIFSQAAETRNPEVRIINYFPGEIYERMKQLDGYCKKEREKDPSFKYQIRLGLDDLTLKTKTDLSQKFEEQPITKFGPLCDIKMVFL